MKTIILNSEQTEELKELLEEKMKQIEESPIVDREGADPTDTIQYHTLYQIYRMLEE